MKRLVSIALVGLAGLTAACDDDATGPGVEGTFDLAVSGAVEETAQGPAWFGSDVDDEGDPVFALVLGTETSRHAVIVGREGAGRPGVGTYELGQGGWELLHMLSDGDEVLGLFHATEGTVTITSSSSSELRGSIEFVATGILGMNEVEIEGEITFEAAPATAAVQSLAALRGRR